MELVLMNTLLAGIGVKMLPVAAVLPVLTENVISSIKNLLKIC
jgi:hypothetical protein